MANKHQKFMRDFRLMLKKYVKAEATYCGHEDEMENANYLREKLTNLVSDELMQKDESIDRLTLYAQDHQ